jgi:hypothetical protein
MISRRSESGSEGDAMRYLLHSDRCIPVLWQTSVVVSTGYAQEYKPSCACGHDCGMKMA